MLLSLPSQAILVNIVNECSVALARNSNLAYFNLSVKKVNTKLSAAETIANCMSFCGHKKTLLTENESHSWCKLWGFVL